MEEIQNNASQQQKAVEMTGEAKTTKESSSKSKKVPTPIVKYGPDVMKVQHEEISRMSSDHRFAMTVIPGSPTSIVNITEAAKAGIEFYRKKDNRIHGRDMEKTGSSLLIHGAQLALSICPVREAREAGIEFERFQYDPNKGKPMSEDGFMVIEGHGRIDYLLDKPLEKWPIILGLLPLPDKDGEIHIENGFIELNQNDSIWGSKDYILIRLADPASHEGWKFIKELQNKKLGFTVATIFATGKEGSINKKTILNPSVDTETLFENLDDSKKLFNAAENAFGIISTGALGTKSIPNKLFGLVDELTKCTKLTYTKAIDYVAEFLASLTNGQTAVINSAKKEGEKDRDTVRREHLIKYFENYKKNNPIV